MRRYRGIRFDMEFDLKKGAYSILSRLEDAKETIGIFIQAAKRDGYLEYAKTLQQALIKTEAARRDMLTAPGKVR